ncbi:MAG: mannose-1-phosphate guanylyltransferase [Kiritimatiellaeota bacterium]|nr:mannose-1-phosphate guanylyltransferase [Kiritimatiellota bacterium]
MGATRAAVIMAGGVGERFWPLSRQTRPKQLLRLTGSGAPMLVDAVSRLKSIVPSERIFIVTGRHLVAPIRAARSGVPPENVIAEPFKRNTTGCLVYAAGALLSRLGCRPTELTLGIVAADHLVGDADRFRQTVRAAFAAAEAESVLVIVGVRPTRPETGYGYIEVDKVTDRPQPDCLQVHTVRRFHEKPDRASAEAYLAAGRFFWNSGMFFWRVSTFLAQLEHADPGLSRIANQVIRALAAGDELRGAEVFAALPNKSIDYVLMEKAAAVRMVPALFAWDDVGAWDALGRSVPTDASGNVAIGAPILIGTAGSIVVNDLGPERMAVAVVGMEDVVVVVTGDAVLVVSRDRAQEVRRVVEELRRRGASQL